MRLSTVDRSRAIDLVQDAEREVVALGMIAGMLVLNALAFRDLYEVYGA